MKYRIILISIYLLSHLSAFAQINKSKGKLKLPSISEELIAMRFEKQKNWKKYVKLIKKGKKNTKGYKKLSQKILATDRINTNCIREIVFG